MEINAEKTRVMTNNAEDIRGDIRSNDKRLKTVNQFKYFDAIVRAKGSKPEILSRIAQATHAMSQLKIILKTKTYLSRHKEANVHTLYYQFFSMHAKHEASLMICKNEIHAMEMRCF